MKTKLGYWRASRGLTLEELAAKSGVNRDTISRIENKRTKARGVTLGRLAKALDVELKELLEEEPNSEEEPSQKLVA